MQFGKGDGGGGPTWQHLERLRRLRGMADTNPGVLARTHVGASADDFFDRLEPKASSLVTWYGELYFELHRGVYTTQARTKLNNRRSEFLLHDLELLATIASVQDSGYKYPKKEFDEMWQGVMLCQFHDCLPGTAIEMCYDDSEKIYAKVNQTAEALFQKIFTVLGIEKSEISSSKIDTAVALNTLLWPRKELVDISETEAVVASGEGHALAVKTFSSSSDNANAVTVQETSSGVFQLENAHLTVKIEGGVITSLYDRRAKRETLSGKANQYSIFDDKPVYWQAWDVEVYHLETREELTNTSTKISEDKGYRASVVVETRVSEKSSMKTTISLDAVLDDEPSLVKCTADVEWHETMKFLKVEFPVQVTNTEASYETQYGIIKRPTHYNTS